jgi:DNA-directed RNA polymerase specialized sigma24 family protein
MERRKRYRTEAELVRGLKARENEACELFDKEYMPGLDRAIRQAMGPGRPNSDELDQLAQLLRLELLLDSRVLDDFDPGRGSLAAFLAGVTQRRVRQHFRKRRRARLQLVPLSADIAQPDAWNGLDDLRLKESAQALSMRDQELLWSILGSGKQPQKPRALSARDRQRWHRILVKIRKDLKPA